jgi:hypothetical protein
MFGKYTIPLIRAGKNGDVRPLEGISMKNSEFRKSARRRYSFVGVLLPVAVLSVFFLSFSFHSFADGYKVDYAIDARGVAESEGPVECTYGKFCRLEFKTAHITIVLYDSGRFPSTRSVTVYGAGNGCCYFSSGDRSKDIKYELEENYIEDYNYKRRYIKLDIFEGRARRHWILELFTNPKIGTVFLGFP